MQVTGFLLCASHTVTNSSLLIVYEIENMVTISVTMNIGRHYLITQSQKQYLHKCTVSYVLTLVESRVLGSLMKQQFTKIQIVTVTAHLQTIGKNQFSYAGKYPQNVRRDSLIWQSTQPIHPPT